MATSKYDKPFERGARIGKAWAIADTVRKLAAQLDEAPSALAKRMDSAQRNQVCTLAGQRVASERTWQLVVSSLELAERPMIDPFAGITERDVVDPRTYDFRRRS
jgi:hypothetical protein